MVCSYVGRYFVVALELQGGDNERGMYRWYSMLTNWSIISRYLRARDALSVTTASGLEYSGTVVKRGRTKSTVERPYR
jgi:hypothetical protein